MKPIKLVIKGLNSFIEEQTIDFEKLTERGLFGIFGPTGSGKSTILDGITLALYGDISRKSSNFINTNCNDLNVCYQFQISGAVDHVYSVARQFKRDKKTGNAKTHAASVVELTPEGPKVLAEGATQVTKACREILGLSLEDFTRTVVLPQGKFSEFLKLEGKSRREMLERLFNLQEYGEELSQKLNRQINLEKNHDNQLIGELKGYEDISEDKLKEGIEQLELSSQKLKELTKQQKQMEKKFKEDEEIWKLQKEMQGYHIRQQELIEQQPQIQEEEHKAKMGESALRVYPSLTAYENTQKSIEAAMGEAKNQEERAAQLSKEKEALEEKYERAAKKKEEKLPALKEKQQQLELVRADDQAVIKLEKELFDIQEKLRGVESKNKLFTAEEEKAIQALKECSMQIAAKQKEEEALRVDENVRRYVQQGLMLTQRFELVNSSKQQKVTRLKELEQEKAGLHDQLETLQKQLSQVNDKVAAKQKEQEALKEPPFTQEALMKKQGEVTSLKEKQARLQVIQKEITAYDKQNHLLAEDEKQLMAAWEDKKKKVTEVKENLEKEKLHNMTYLLQQHLHTGDCCPVCGGVITHLGIEAHGETETLQQLEVLLQEVQAESDRQEKALREVQLQQRSNMQACEKLQSEAAPLKELFETMSIEQAQAALKADSGAVKAYEQQKKELDELVDQLKQERADREKELGQKETALFEINKQKETLEREIEGQQKEIEAVQAELGEVKKQVENKEFSIISQEIAKKDRKREELTKAISELSKTKEEKQRQKEELQEKISKYSASFQRGLAQFDEKQKNKMAFMHRIGSRLSELLSFKEEASLLEKQEHIAVLIHSSRILEEQLKEEYVYASVLETSSQDTNEDKHEDKLSSCDAFFSQYPLIGNGLIQLEEELQLLGSCMKQITQEIETQFDQVQKAREEMTVQYDQAVKKLLEVKAKLEELQKRFAEEELIVEKSLKEEQLTKKQVKEYLLSREAIEALKEQISAYKAECSKLSGAMENAAGKLAGRKLEEAEWQSTQQALEQITEQASAQNEAYINQSTYVKNMEAAIKKLGELRKEKEKLDHKMAILSDLDKLFKGKRFVEYVASTRLKYISIEASKKLKEITCGNYGLEVDEDGRFIIRDYKNGGAQRDASTLSGGETFLASLALALALSAEIQLKGTAPLEFFFLDEGFGTLDDELLDTVMSSLERIHHDKLSVGIISHVETIKNRVPVKLILTPAEAGMGGTKVRLERS